MAAAKLMHGGMVRMPEGANPSAGRVGHQRLEAEAAAFVIVEPDALAAGLRMERAMHGDELARDFGFERKAGEERELVLAQPLARPGRRPCRGIAESLGRDLPADRAVVVAGDAQAIGAADQRNAFAGIGVVADNVAEADDAID